MVDKLAANGIDLTRDAIEVSPIAHYHMGGVRVDAAMRTDMPGLLAAGEAVGGANGANRLSGNAITEALAFGRIAGREAARLAEGAASPEFTAGPALDLLRASEPRPLNTAALVARLQAVMSADVGPFRTAAGLCRADAAITDLQTELGAAPPGTPGQPHDLARLDWFDLRQMLLVARAVVQAALAREESRGAHQREDFPDTREDWRLNQLIRGEALALSRVAVPA